MIASVHIANVGAGSGLALVRRSPKSSEIAGLRHAKLGQRAVQRIEVHAGRTIGQQLFTLAPRPVNTDLQDGLRIIGDRLQALL